MKRSGIPVVTDATTIGELIQMRREYGNRRTREACIKNLRANGLTKAQAEIRLDQMLASLTESH